MRFFDSHISPPIQLRYAAPSSPYLPASRIVFPRRRIGYLYSIRRVAPLFGLAGRDTIVFLPAFPFRLTGRIGPASLSASLSVQSASRLPPRFAFRQTARCLPYYPFSYTAGGEDACFSRVCPFSPSISLRHVIHYRYICGRGGTADTPDLGSGGEIRVGSNPTARTMATHSPPP